MPPSSAKDDEAKGKVLVLKTKLQIQKADRAKVEEEKKMIPAKLDEFEAFLLRISKNCYFFQGVRQAAFLMTCQSMMNGTMSTKI